MSDVAFDPTATAGEPRLPICVTTDLDVTLDGQPVQVASTGDRLFVDLPSVRAARQALRAGHPARDPRLDSVLHATALTVEVRVRGTTVAVLGAAARPGAISRGVGVAPAELRLGGVVAAVGRGALAALRRDGPRAG